MIVPVSGNARRLVTDLQSAGVPIGVADRGTDLGIDTTSGRCLKVKGQKKRRIKGTAARAKRAGMLTKVRKGCKRLDCANVVPTHSYGQLVLGMAPANRKKCMELDQAVLL